MVTTEQLPIGDQPIRIQDEMRTSYLTYAMSVIVARALPDVRDGLKPVSTPHSLRDARHGHPARLPAPEVRAYRR